MLKFPGLEPIPQNNIVYLAGDGSYTEVYTVDGRLRVSSINLSRAQSMVPTFVRIHKEYLINPAYIKRVDPPSKHFMGSLTLITNKTLPISRRRWPEVSGHLLERHPVR